jgi:phenylpropionate dioxygenase-like ring-hydroxylating dioxygenase large terminal subunit
MVSSRENHDSRPGQLKSIHYFGRDLVLWRTNNGEVSLLDAFCPHLGAHFGQGKIDGDTIQCPFHGWRFNAAGNCIYVSGNRKIPPKAKSRSWPVVEANGQIMTYFHPHDQAPT